LITVHQKPSCAETWKWFIWPKTWR